MKKYCRTYPIEMLSSRIYLILCVPFTLSLSIRANCRWCDYRRQRFVYESQLQPRVRKNFVGFICYCILRLGLTLKLGYDGGVNDFHLFLAFWLLITLVIVVYGIPVWYEEDAATLLNGAFMFFRNLQQTYMPHFNPEKSRLNKLIDASMVLLIFVGVVLCVSFCIYFIHFPRGPLSLSPLIPEKHFILPVQIFAALPHLYFIAATLGNLTALASTILAYLVYFTLLFIRELRLGQRNYLTDVSLRKADNLRQAYRSFQILHEHAMSFMGLFILLLNGTFMVTILYENFVLIRYWDDLHFTTKASIALGAIMISAFWAAVLIFGREFCARGNKVVASWRHGEWDGTAVERTIMRKFARSCRPILLSYGKQFVIGRVSVLVFFRGVIRGTVRALLTTK